MLTVFLLGGGLLGGFTITPADVDLVGERIELVIEDTARASAAREILGGLEAEVENFDRIFIDAGDSLRDLYLDHGAGSLETRRTLETLNLEWYASQNRSVKLRERLKEKITSEEWARIFEAQ